MGIGVFSAGRSTSLLGMRLLFELSSVSVNVLLMPQLAMLKLQVRCKAVVSLPELLQPKQQGHV